MDSGHRHELKTNDLADSLAHLPELIKKNANMIIGLTLIAVGLITWPMFSKMSQKKQFAEQSEITQTIQMLNQDVYNVLRAPVEDAQAKTDALNILLVNADTLLEKASSVKNPNLAAMAQIKAAQAIRTELHLRQDVDVDTLESQIQKAKDAYQKAFETAETPTIKAMAQLGLGLCSEELGQTAQAADIYQKIVDNKSFEATVPATQAQQRLDNLEENAESFNFAAVPVVIEEPASANTELPVTITPQEAEATAVVESAVEEATETLNTNENAATESPEPETEQP